MYNPNLGLVFTVLDQEREQGCSQESIEGAKGSRGEHYSTEGARRSITGHCQGAAGAVLRRRVCARNEILIGPLSGARCLEVWTPIHILGLLNLPKFNLSARLDSTAAAGVCVDHSMKEKLRDLIVLASPPIDMRGLCHEIIDFYS